MSRLWTESNDLFTAARFHGKFHAVSSAWKSRYDYLYKTHPDLLGEEYMSMLREETKQKETVQLYWLITINAPSSTEILDFRSCVDKMLTKKWLNPYYACAYEFFNDSGEFTHPHVHVFCKKVGSKQNRIKELYSTFKHILPNPASIDIRSVCAPCAAYQYVNKSRESDQVYRKKCGLLDIYYSDKFDKQNFEKNKPSSNSTECLATLDDDDVFLEESEEKDAEVCSAL